TLRVILSLLPNEVCSYAIQARHDFVNVLSSIFRRSLSPDPGFGIRATSTSVGVKGFAVRVSCYSRTYRLRVVECPRRRTGKRPSPETEQCAPGSCSFSASPLQSRCGRRLPMRSCTHSYRLLASPPTQPRATARGG